MADLDMIYGLELTGDKELVSRMHAVNSALDATKKTFLSLKKEMTGGKLNAFQTNNVSKEYEKAKIELIKLRQESVRLTNENKVQLRITRERREQERLAKKEASQSVNTYKEMSKELTQARNQLKSLLLEGKGNSTLAQKLKQDVTELDNKLKQVDAQTGQFYRNVGNYPQNNGLIKLGADVNKLILGYVGLHAAMNLLSSTVSNVAELSDETANLEIELGKAKGGAQGLVDELSKLDTRTKTVDLVGMANIAVKAGVSEENLVDVTKAVDRIKTAFGKDFGDVETGTESLVKLINIFEGSGNVTGENLLRMGNAIRTIANESVASVPFLNDFSKRMAGLKGISDISLPAVLGLASGFEQFGQSAEVSSTALVKIIPKFATDTAKYAKIAGMTQEEFKKLLNSKPEEALIKVSEALVKGKGDIEGISQAFADSELGKGRVTSILGTLGKNADAFRKTIASAGEAYGDTSNILDAFNAKNETFAAKLDKIKKQFADLSNSEGFKNFVTSIANSILIIVKLLTSIPFGVVITGISLMSGAWAYYRGVAIAAYIAQQWNNRESLLGIVRLSAQRLRLIANTSATVAQTTATTGATVAQRGLNAAMMANPLGLILGLVAALVPWLISLAEETDGATESMDGLNKTFKTQAEVQNAVKSEIVKSVEQTKSKLDILLSVLRDESSSLETRKRVYNELIKLSPTFEGTLDKEYRATNKLTEAYKDYIEVLEKASKAKVIQTMVDKNAEKIADVRMKEFEATQDRIKKEKEVKDNKIAYDKAKKEASFFSFKDTFAYNKYINSRGDLIKSQEAEAKALQATKEAEKSGKELNKYIAGLSEDVKNAFVEGLGSGTSGGAVAGDSTGGDKTGDSKAPRAKYRGASLLGTQKDFLKQQEAIRDTALAINNKRFTEGEIKEKEYLENILKINTDFYSKKMSYLKGNNAQELKERAQADEAQSKLAKETREKLLAIESKRVKNNFEKANATSKSQYDEVNGNPYSTEQEKIDAQKRFSEETLNNRRIFNIEMLGLEMKYKIISTEEEEKRAAELVTLSEKTQNELLRIKSDELKKQSEEIRKNTEDEKNRLENRASEEKLTILNDKKLNLYQKERKEAVINAELKRKLLEEDLKAIGHIIDKYHKKAETSKLTTEEIRMQNLLIKEQSDLKEKLFKAEREETKIRRAEAGIPSDTKSALISGFKRSIRGKEGTGGISLGKDKDGNDVDGTEMLGEILGQSYDLAMQAMNNYFETERQNIERNKQLAYERIDNERKRNIMFAQSSDEVDQINREAERKKKEADKKAFEEKKKIKKQELQMNLATELSAIAVSAAQNKMNGITFGASGLAMYAMLSGMALARYAINLSNIEKQQYAKGGLFGLGGRLKGPSHHENEGIPVINPISGEVQAYLEGDEGIINKRSMSDKRKYTVSGTPSQIASRINALGGGIDWHGGAMISKFANGGAFLGSMVRPPVFADYYKDFGANERLQSIEGLLVETNETLLREVNRKTIVSSREISNTEKEYQRQTTIVNL